jgi:hypothetical protein
MQTKDACQQCCIANHTAGYGKYRQALMSCGCAIGASCKAACATEFCASMQTNGNDACAQCLTTASAPSGECYQALSTACQSMLDCTVLFGSCMPQCH